ncbi:hypothetical protein JMA_18260 [Jeotgalibacillus malaysiensis]|uniref:Uncharacterized protein n=1 Tax=Jeotgalibacillus malaysiensis TaxID=1508404 RepID=A0A0B5ARG9_9BACL|nr:hypothetical protein [Jeotgalibacillus malaysiensis]AJD91143.1 hypothetical protein JMA_18260 [Jeotgalibacillus malaysiensis]
MIDQPWFLAVLDTRPNEYEGYHYSVCFINQSDTVIDQLTYTVSGQIKAYHHKVSAEETRELGELKPHYVVEIEHVPKKGFIGDLIYSFDIFSEGKKETLCFFIPKQLTGAAFSLYDLPIVHQRGYFFLGEPKT